MKNLIILLLISLSPVFAQQLNSDLSNEIDQLFSISKNKQYKLAAAHIAFSGENQSRKYIKSLNAENTSELEKAERIAKKIKAYLDISDSYVIKNFSTEKKENFDFTTVTITFKSGNQELDIPFEFVKAKDKYLLVTID